jgi:hypothetical protein
MDWFKVTDSYFLDNVLGHNSITLAFSSFFCCCCCLVRTLHRSPRKRERFILLLTENIDSQRSLLGLGSYPPYFTVNMAWRVIHCLRIHCFRPWNTVINHPASWIPSGDLFPFCLLHLITLISLESKLGERSNPFSFLNEGLLDYTNYIEFWVSYLHSSFRLKFPLL